MKNIPVLVWLVCIFFGLTSTWGLYQFSSYLLGFNSFSPEFTARIAGHGFIDFLLIISNQLLIITSCVFLFRLSKLACDLFAGVVLFNIVSLLWFSTTTDLISSLGWITYLIGMVGLGIGLYIGVFIYTDSLMQRGFLK